MYTPNVSDFFLVPNNQSTPSSPAAEIQRCPCPPISDLSALIIIGSSTPGDEELKKKIVATEKLQVDHKWCSDATIVVQTKFEFTEQFVEERTLLLTILATISKEGKYRSGILLYGPGIEAYPLGRNGPGASHRVGRL